ncbi:MAG: CBS domain-containing protein [Deltaproteobacteria bacterium]|nr:CBS domain-containing protein [Deltaproteobacteria bacterium]
MSTLKNKYTLVSEIMMKPDAFPILLEKVFLKEALEAMGRFRLGIVCIVNERFQLLGIITDGDIRRKLLKVQKPFSAFFVDDALIHAIRMPTTIQPTATLIEGVELMGQKQIWDLPVVDASGKLVGLLHLHPAIRAVLGMDSEL